MIERLHLEEYLEQLLNVRSIKDYCPNGLQVEGASEVRTIVGGVTASQALIDVAIEKGADAVLVHHGYFWKGEREAIRGIKMSRIKALLDHDISLFAYHLPLDTHNELGNNVQLAKLLGLSVTGGLEPGNRNSVGLVGELSEVVTADQFCQTISKALGRKAQMIGAGARSVKRSWPSGSKALSRSRRPR